MDPVGTHNEAEGREDAPNVVRIRRDWYGPPEDLVPIGPRAASAIRADQPDTEVPGEPPASCFEPDPDAFWGESSNSIQDVVDAPRLGGHVGRQRRALGGALRTRRGALVGSVVLGVIAGLGLYGLLIGTSRPSLHRPAIASIGAARTPLHTRRLGTAETNAVGKGFQLRRMTRTSHKTRRVPHVSTVTPVVYHPNQPTYTPPPTYAAATGGPQNQVSSGSSQAATAAPASQSPTAAFGAQGALGPMSSPNG